MIWAKSHVPMSKPQRTNLVAWANYTTEQAKDFLLSLPEELWGDVIDRISHNVSWYRNNDTIVINLALWVKYCDLDTCNLILLAVQLGIVKKVRLVTYLVNVIPCVEDLEVDRYIEYIHKDIFTHFIRLVGKWGIL